jgi:hypothetical protein
VRNPGTASASATWTNTPVDLKAKQNKVTPMMKVYTGERFGWVGYGSVISISRARRHGAMMSTMNTTAAIRSLMNTSA